MKKQIQIILTTIALALTMSLIPSPTASANGPVRLISDIREDFNGLLLQLRVFDNSCVIITGGLLDEFRTLILDGRKLVTTGKGNLGPALAALILRAQFHLNSIFIHAAIYCGGNFIPEAPNTLNTVPQGKKFSSLAFGIGGIGFIGNQLALLRAEIAVLETLDQRKRNKILALLSDALAHVDAIINLSANLFPIQGSCFFDASLALAQVASRVGLNGETLQVVPQLTETGPISFEDLREIKIFLGLAAKAVKDCLHTLREITKEKKWLYKDIREVKELLRASNFGGRAADALLDLPEALTKVYTLNGALVATQSNGLDINRLANGVYLVMTGNKVRKLAVSR